MDVSYQVLLVRPICSLGVCLLICLNRACEASQIASFALKSSVLPEIFIKHPSCIASSIGSKFFACLILLARLSN